jgi:hypothetical protein
MAKTTNLVLKGTWYYAAGEEYRQRRLRKGSQVHLVHTPYNPHDKNAVAVFLMPAGRQLGHVSRDIAPKYAELVDANCVKSAKVVSAEKSSDSNLRIEIQLNIGPPKDGDYNSVTETTQIIPPSLVEVLRQDKRARTAELSRVTENSVREHPTNHAQARRTSTHRNNTPGRRSEGRDAHQGSAQNRWVGAIAGLGIGGLAGGPPGAVMGAICGLVAAPYLSERHKSDSSGKPRRAFLNCATCGDRVPIMTSSDAKWHKCPRCGFTRPRVDR